jgi:hypothetical protein
MSDAAPLPHSPGLRRPTPAIPAPIPCETSQRTMLHSVAQEPPRPLGETQNPCFTRLHRPCPARRTLCNTRPYRVSLRCTGPRTNAPIRPAFRPILCATGPAPMFHFVAQTTPPAARATPLEKLFHNVAQPRPASTSTKFPPLPRFNHGRSATWGVAWIRVPGRVGRGYRGPWRRGDRSSRQQGELFRLSGRHFRPQGAACRASIWVAS